MTNDSSNTILMSSNTRVNNSRRHTHTHTTHTEKERAGPSFSAGIGVGVAIGVVVTVVLVTIGYVILWFTCGKQHTGAQRGESVTDTHLHVHHCGNVCSN